MPQIAALYCYPVKGLSAEPLDAVAIGAGETLPFDRAYAIENGRSKFNPDAPSWQPKASFLMLMKNERLAELATHFDPATGVLVIRRNGDTVIEANLDTTEGRRNVEAFFDAFAAPDLRGPTKVLHVDGHSFSDVAAKCVSLINLASVRDLERHVGSPVHPLRFRGNLYVEGLPAWAEFDWEGAEVRAGDVRFKVTGRINRCAATNVDPLTARRDLSIPETLDAIYGAPDCGVYLEVIQGGELRVGEAIGPA